MSKPKCKKLTQPTITQPELNRIEKYLREVKKNGYRPWVTVRQSHTIGQGQIVYSWKTKRDHHLLSRGELMPFLWFEQDPKVIDILEQYPLPLEDTLKLADEMQILHPGSYLDKDAFDGLVPAKTMTTDYVLVMEFPDGRHKLAAYSFKYSSSFERTVTHPVAVARTEAKLALECEYWRRLNVPWVLITEKSFDGNVTQNFRYLRECKDFPEYLDVSDEFKAIVLLRFRHHFSAIEEATVRQVLVIVAEDVGIELFQCQCLFQYFVYTNILKLNLTQTINLNRPISMMPIEVSHAS